MKVLVKNPINGAAFKHRLCNYKTKCCSFPYFYHPCCVSNALKIFKDLSELLDKENIKYFLITGTALGWRRHGQGIIPWDDDIDIACFMKDRGKISEILEEMKTLGYISHHSKGKGKGIYPPYDYFSIDYSKNNKIHVNISLLTELSFEGKEYYGDFPNISIPDKKRFNELKPWLIRKNWIFPLNRTQLYDIPCYTMNKDIKQLKFWYGDDVLEKAVAKPRPLPGTRPDVSKNKLETDFFPQAERLLTKTIRQSPNEKIGINRVLTINEDRRIDRLHWMISQCDKNDLWMERVPAVFITEEKYRELQGTFWDNTDDFKLNRTEIGCMLSHLKCWEIIAKEEDSNMFLVTEDDIEFSSCFNETLSRFLKNYQKNNDLIRLGVDLYNAKDIEEVGPNLYEIGLATGTYAYLLHPKQARFFLNLVKSIFPMKYPIDLVIVVHDLKKFPTRRAFDKRVPHMKSFLLHCNENKEKFKKQKQNRRLGIVFEWSTLLKDSSTQGEGPRQKTFTNIAKINIIWVWLLFLFLLWVWLYMFFRFSKTQKK